MSDPMQGTGPRPDADGDDEPDYDSASDISEIDPESDVLAPVQERIEAQLRKHLQELTQQLHETGNELKGIEKNREDAGVELYNAQQHLAKLQETLEKQNEAHAKSKQEHEDRLQQRDQLSSVVDESQKRLTDLQKQYAKHQSELAKLTETIAKVERFNDDLKQQVELEKNAAHKTETDITELEKAKLSQDTLIASLQQQLKNLENQSASLDEQIENQKKETRVARDTLAEAMAEMESISQEKKQLVTQWKSSLLGMQRRHDALRKAESALQQQKEDLQVLENEINGFRKDVRDVEAENTKLTEFMSRVDNEIVILEKQVDTLLEKKERNAQDYAMMTKAIEKTSGESKLLETELKGKNKELSELEKQIVKHAKAINDMENDVLGHLSRQTTLKQESQGALHEIEGIKKAIRAKELQVSQMENELARIRVDTIQSKSYNETLQTTLDELEKELQSRGVMIERMQVDIRRRNEEIDKKQKELDQLNRRWEQILSAHAGEDTAEHEIGPMEATISKLSKDITAKSNENEALQQEWIKLQTELVSCKNTMNEINEAILDTQAKNTILTQKKDRLLANIASEKQEIAALEKKTNAMHQEVRRINTLLSRNTDNRGVLENDTYLVETDLIRRLEEKKREAIQMENKVEEARAQKEELLEQIIDAERDIMFWERKLQIARETEMALDPTIGKSEIEKMKKEIGFMEQRLTQLQRESKFLIDEMQRLVDHRDTIRTKGKAIETGTQAKGGKTRNTVEKENARLFKELNAKRQEAQAKERAIKDSLAEVDRIAAEIDSAQREINATDEEIEALQAQLLAAQRERDHAEDEKKLKQTTLQRLRDGEKGNYKLQCYPEEMDTEETRLQEGRRAVAGIMEELVNQFPDLATELNDLMTAV